MDFNSYKQKHAFFDHFARNLRATVDHLHDCKDQEASTLTDSKVTPHITPSALFFYKRPSQNYEIDQKMYFRINRPIFVFTRQIYRYGTTFIH